MEDRLLPGGLHPTKIIPIRWSDRVGEHRVQKDAQLGSAGVTFAPIVNRTPGTHTGPTKWYDSKVMQQTVAGTMTAQCTT